MILVIETQVMENYGDAENPYWKFKGGHSYKIRNVPGSLGMDALAGIIKALGLPNDEWYQEYATGEHYENDDWMSWFEQSQLDYDGSVAYPEPSFDYVDLVNRILVD